MNANKGYGHATTIYFPAIKQLTIQHPSPYRQRSKNKFSRDLFSI